MMDHRDINLIRHILPALLISVIAVMVIACQSQMHGRDDFGKLDTLKTEQLAAGVTYQVLKHRGIPLTVRLITIDRTRSQAEIKFGLAKKAGKAKLGYLSTVSKIISENESPGEDILAAVNAGMFFTTNGKPVGLIIRNHEIVNMPYRPVPRYFFYITDSGRLNISRYYFKSWLETKDGTKIDIETVNRFGKTFRTALINHFYPVSGFSLPSDLYLRFHTLKGYAINRSFRIVVDSLIKRPFNGPLSRSGSVIVARGQDAEHISEHIMAGDTLNMQVDIMSNGASIRNAMEGWPPMRLNGRDLIRSKSSGLKYGWLFAHLPVARTAMGVSRNGRFCYIIAVDGPSDWTITTVFSEIGRWAGLSGKNESFGMSLPSLSNLMHQIGAWQAINLDGGSSTVMIIHDRQVSNPNSDVPERPVANALMITQKEERTNDK